MKYRLFPIWAALAFAGNLSAVTPTQAQADLSASAEITSVQASVQASPTHLQAQGMTHPIGSQVQLSWFPVSNARGYNVYRDTRFLAYSASKSFVDYAVAGGETHAYAVSSLGLAGESRQSASVTASVPLGGGQVIFADSFQNGWQPAKGAGASLDSGTAKAGRALRILAGPSQAFSLHHAPFHAADYAAVTFWINGDVQGGQRLAVRALRGGVPQTPVALSPLAAGTWQSVTIPLHDLGVDTATNMDGLWIQNTTAAALPAFSLDEIALTSAAAGPPAPPAAPTGLTATPQWSAHCVKCGGMPMAHILLAWNTVSGASSYTLYRNGVVLQAGLTDPAWTDMDVVSGQTYSYAVTATGAGGESIRSAAISAVAPSPPATATSLTAPTNLSVQGVWLGAASDVLTWSPAAGAVSYNVYQYDVPLAQGVTATSYPVPVSQWYSGPSYSVTAVDASGMESLPSAIATAQGSFDPSQSPSWLVDAPAPPTDLVATAEWNAGAPRISLRWRGEDQNYTYKVYRDGKKVAEGLWGLNYYDQSVNPGETHVYAVSGSNVRWTTPAESALSTAVTAPAALSGPAAPGTPVQITGVQANDDSALVTFAAVPGAVDYRVYDAAKPNSAKYSGGSLSIEMNNLDPDKGADLVVEAVDKLGPFQKMDAMAGPGAMQMGEMHVAINGQGDPSNLPNVLATSAPTHVTCKPATLSGAQIFFDTFRSEQPLVALPCPAPIPGDTSNEYGHPDTYLALGNDKWEMRQYSTDMIDSKVFFMSNHFMDTLYDGGSPKTNGPMHNNNSTVAMMPKATADISGGKVLHVTFEVDPHMGDRRWCDLFVAAAGDTLVDPGKFADFPGHRPTMSGRLFRWEIREGAHSLSVFPGIAPDAASDQVHLTHQDNGVGPDSFGLCARSGPYCTIPFNGTAGDLDKRHKFDLYLSKTRAVILEAGHVIKDVAFPDGTPLPFDQCQVYFIHQVYHTSNDRDELITYHPESPYWYNNRPWCDERHWDNMGQEVLTGFPALP